MIDSHCHLADAKFAADLPDVIARATKNGVDRMVTIADTLEEAEKCIAIAEKHPQIFATVGVHPHEAKSWKQGDDDRLRLLVQSSKKVKAVGEIGLDYHYDFSPRDTQREVFALQLKIAKEIKKPAVIHCREAVEDLWMIIEKEKPASLVLHCCTEKWEDVERFIAAGYLLSFTGITTYPNAADIRKTIKHCPLSQMMIETDAPYLAPVPHRGKRNEPAFVIEVAKAIADIKGVSVEEVDAATTANAVEFYRLPS
ncbi:hypothetical protein A2706_02150 [Candidatus Peribacteria bacterium RIFCSPHIGHO2_01_FULL_51_35]|nr:MAG: hypothetical protein A2706_02150 [Candidatus Peribacteria bacterium RIFCSPHIGHO2_01_FULL_51_35]